MNQHHHLNWTSGLGLGGLWSSVESTLFAKTGSPASSDFHSIRLTADGITRGDSRGVSSSDDLLHRRCPSAGAVADFTFAPRRAVWSVKSGPISKVTQVLRKSKEVRRRGASTPKICDDRLVPLPFFGLPIGRENRHENRFACIDREANSQRSGRLSLARFSARVKLGSAWGVVKPGSMVGRVSGDGDSVFRRGMPG